LIACRAYTMEESRQINHSYDLAASSREINLNSMRLIGNIMGTYMDESLPMRLRCECGRMGCDVIINITLEQRRDARASYPQGFIINRTHLSNPPDKVLFHAPGFLVVGKER
jgi:hypothetical protein